MRIELIFQIFQFCFGTFLFQLLTFFFGCDPFLSDFNSGTQPNDQNQCNGILLLHEPWARRGNGSGSLMQNAFGNDHAVYQIDSYVGHDYQ